MRAALALITVAACSGDIQSNVDNDAARDGDGAPIVDGAPGAPDARITPDAPGGVGEPAELAGITLAHNEARAQVGDPPLTWDPLLAQIAANWAAQCVDTMAPIGLIDHNPGRSDTYSTYVGENIYGSSGTSTAQAAVASWVSEGQFYDYASNTCATGKICGHYTQVVWKSTLKLGCALHQCPGLTYGSSLVCDYGPGGNDGNRPY